MGGTALSLCQHIHTNHSRGGERLFPCLLRQADREVLSENSTAQHIHTNHSPWHLVPEIRDLTTKDTLLFPNDRQFRGELSERRER